MAQSVRTVKMKTKKKDAKKRPKKSPSLPLAGEERNGLAAKRRLTLKAGMPHSA